MEVVRFSANKAEHKSGSTTGTHSRVCHRFTNPSSGKWSVEEAPPSRLSSEGGIGGGVSTEETAPPSRLSSEGGVERVC